VATRKLILETPDEQKTEEAGASLAPLLREGDVVLLHGELGAGKTCFARGILSALHHDGGMRAKSPTYTILNIYDGVPNVYHYDFYRVEDGGDIVALGLDDFWGKGICLVEWPKSFCYSLPGRKIDVSIALTGGGRRIEVTIPDVDETFLQSV